MTIIRYASILNQTKITGQSSQQLGPLCLWQCLNHDLIMISQVENIYLDVKTALEKILTQATWMDEETRNR